MEEELAGKDNLILALNSGSSSLKFGVYRRGATDEEPLLTGTAEGIGRKNGQCSSRGSTFTSHKGLRSPLSPKQSRSVSLPCPWL